MTDQEAREVAKKIQNRFGGYTDRVQPHFFEDLGREGFLFFLKEPGPKGEDFARVEFVDREDGTWCLFMEPAAFFKRTMESLGFALVDDLDDEVESGPDGLPVVRRKE